MHTYEFVCSEITNLDNEMNYKVWNFQQCFVSQFEQTAAASDKQQNTN